ncbi:putative inner membrane transporter yiJE [Peptococcaceae bacterium CEB3]|nr:putative inner membrane transporter yiJE [Peptococcaceae bacterium CEB3]
MKSTYLGGLYMALAASIWGGMYVVSKILLENIAPFVLVWIRYLVASLTLAIGIAATGQSWRIRRRHLPLVAAIGIVGYALSIWLQFLGTKLSTAQMGAIITSTTPAFMVVFSRFILGEKITVRKAFSVGLATVGVLMIVGNAGFGQSDRLGGVILFAAALAWALMSVLVKLVPKSYSQLTVTFYAILVATLGITPAAAAQLLRSSPGIWLQPSIWSGVLYLGVISTAGAFFLWNKGLQLVNASSGGLYFFFQPLVGTFLGWLILGETVGFSFWLGAVLILTGIALVAKES